MKARARAGIPLALSWRRGGRFRVVMEDGEEVQREGWVSPPFGIFRGNGGGGRAYPPPEPVAWGPGRDRREVP